MSWKSPQNPSRIPEWVPAWMRGLIRWLLKWGLIGAALLIAVSLFYFFLSLKYDLTEVAKMPEHSVILDRKDKEFATIHGERRRRITREEIPEVMVQALRAREDLRFPNHHGVDLKGLARAMLRNIKDASFTQGASTLTMQLTRNTFELRAKSLHRKLLEIAITLRIEHRYNKDEILTHYLNRIYFGSGCHGVEEAAQTYFGKSTADLTTGECALLVGIIRGPHLFSPFRNYRGALTQRDEVLDRMVQCGFLTAQDAQKLKAEKIKLVPEKDRHKGSSYVRESIRKQLNVILDHHDIRNGGLMIYTTLDARMQKGVERILKNPLKGIENNKVTELQAAVVRMNPTTGGILAVCGGRNFNKSPFNRAYLAKRDLGAAFAPFLHALALERGKVALVGHPVQTGRQLGVQETIRLSKRLGFTGPFQKTEDLYRGALSVSPMELAIATSILSNKGKKPDPFLIRKITDAQGRVLYKYKVELHQALTKDSAEETLAENKGFLTSKGWVSTTTPCRDVWGIRRNASSITVMWLGYDKPRKIGDAEKIKKAAARILANFPD